MVSGSEPRFLARESYRRRRVIDAIKLLPLLAFVLWVLPGFFQTTTAALIYIFTIWAALIAFVRTLSRRVDETHLATEADDGLEASEQAGR